ncbi:hypothetical protein B0H13DRAFT_1888034 [Mycena leptocephala]|nr:hypothetical protein B0H13DRAFT_1888034 [Mycena leptocephala]
MKKCACAFKLSPSAARSPEGFQKKTVCKPIQTDRGYIPLPLDPSPSAKDLKPCAPNPDDGDEEEVDEKWYKTRHRPEEKQSVHDSDRLTLEVITQRQASDGSPSSIFKPTYRPLPPIRIPCARARGRGRCMSRPSVPARWSLSGGNTGARHPGACKDTEGRSYTFQSIPAAKVLSDLSLAARRKYIPLNLIGRGGQQLIRDEFDTDGVRSKMQHLNASGWLDRGSAENQSPRAP